MNIKEETCLECSSYRVCGLAMEHCDIVIQRILDNASASVEMEFENRKVSVEAKKITRQCLKGEITSKEAIMLIVRLHLKEVD